MKTEKEKIQMRALRSFGVLIASFIIFFGLLASVQGYNIEKVTQKDVLLNALEPMVSNMLEEECAEAGEFKDSCIAQASSSINLSEKIDGLYMASVKIPLIGAISLYSLNSIASASQGSGLMVAAAGILLILVILKDKLKILKILGGIFVSLSVATYGGAFLVEKAILPRLLSGQLSAVVSLADFFSSQLLNFQFYVGKLFLIAGISLYASYFLIRKYLFSEVGK
jgi:hypothetical protein